MKADRPDALKNVRFRAEIDWITVRVTLPCTSQFRHVQRRLEPVFGKIYVSPCDGVASSSRFDLTVHNPAGAEQFMRDIQAIVKPGDRPIAEDDIEIVGIEVAIDGYIPGSDHTSLAEATAHLARHIAKRPAGSPRATSPRAFKAPATPRELIQLIAQGASINMGVRNASFRVRAYLKNYDTIRGERLQLPPEKHRARIEITLASDQLPFKTINDWGDFRFHGLSARRFAMVRPVAADGMAKVLQSRTTFLGRAEDSYKIRPSDRRERSAFTRRDSVTNDAIRQALENLTVRQSCRNSESKTGRIPACPEWNGNFDRCVLNTLIQPTASASPSPIQSPLTTTKEHTVVQQPGCNSNQNDTDREDEFECDISEHWGVW